MSAETSADLTRFGAHLRKRSEHAVPLICSAIGNLASSAETILRLKASKFNLCRLKIQKVLYVTSLKFKNNSALNIAIT